jgi:uncharacterized iron-regulated membrane protein
MTTYTTPPQDNGPATASTIAEPGSTPRARNAVKALALRVHFLAGLAIAPFLAVLCLTGLGFAFSPQVNDLLYADELYVDNPGGPQRPLTEQVDAALAAHPAGKLQSVITAPDPESTTRVVLSEPGLVDTGDPFSSERLTVFVNPYTGTLTGQLVTVVNETPAQVWLRDMHGNLHLGDPGRLYAEFVASWLPVIILGGLILWIGRRRKRRREVLLPTLRNRTGRLRLTGVHGALGLWLAAGLIAVSITGLTWSQYAGDRFSQAIEALDGTSPRLTAADITVPPNATPITFDETLRIARTDGLEGPLTITPPSTPAGPIVVQEAASGLPVQRDNIAIDPYRADITERLGWQDYPLLAKLTTLGIQAHSGQLLGLANQIAMALLAIGTLTLLVLGYRMWWHRRPANGALAPIPPQAWHRFPQWVVFLIVLTTAVLAWVIPVLGVTLGAFLVLDAAYNTFRRKARPE